MCDKARHIGGNGSFRRYTPDFTSHMVLHKLRLVTSQGNEMVFTLNVTLPPYMLPLCQETVPRPSWEPTLYYFIVSVIVILSVGVLLMGWLEVGGGCFV